MGSPEQDPRSLSARLPAVRISAVMAGMEWVDPGGATRIAAGDVVLIELLDSEGGSPVATLAQNPDSSLSLAIAIQQAAIQLINAEVNDDGEKAGPLERMARIHNAYKEAP